MADTYGQNPFRERAFLPTVGMHQTMPYAKRRVLEKG